MPICFIHKFQTEDVDEWDWHCFSLGHVNEKYTSIDGKMVKTLEAYPRHYMRDQEEKARREGKVLVKIELAGDLKDDYDPKLKDDMR